MTLPIDIPTEQVEAFCRRHAIRTLWLFGSVIRDDFTSESDVDVLVEFEPGTRVGYPCTKQYMVHDCVPSRHSRKNACSQGSLRAGWTR